MLLEKIVKLSQKIPFQSIALDEALAREVQVGLIRLGLLDGPPDGKFGPVSKWALGALIASKMPVATLLDSELADLLLHGEEWPLFPSNDFAGKVVQRMLDLGFFFVRHPDCVNIVYVEGCDTNGRLNENRPNEFNDVRMIISCDTKGVPQAETWTATTEPGTLYTINPLESDGAARIAFDQFKAWCVGKHPGSGSSQHEALVQVSEINIYRDRNKDFKRWGDRQFRGLFGINQHWGYDYSAADIRDASAGCLVGRTKEGHREFMRKIKSDPRFLANSGYRFHTAIIDGTTIPA